MNGHAPGRLDARRRGVYAAHATHGYVAVNPCPEIEVTDCLVPRQHCLAPASTGHALLDTELDYVARAASQWCAGHRVETQARSWLRLFTSFCTGPSLLSYAGTSRGSCRHTSA